MNRSYLEVTYRKGHPFAASLYLPRQANDLSSRTERVDGGLIVNYSDDGRVIGIEIPSPLHVDVTALNAILASHGHDPLHPADLSPLVAA